MDKNKKLPHLYRIDRESGYKGWALNATALFEDGPQLSQVITDGTEKTGLKKGEFIVMALLEWRSGTMAQEHNEHALKILNVPLPMPLTTEVLNRVIGRLENAKKALDGWPTKNTREFVDEDSDEYKTWVEEQGDE